ncbi:MAG: sugar-binding protein, partial [Gemmataceae bacterium]
MKPLHCLACAAFALSLIGCKGESGKPRVAFVSNNPETFWSIARKGAEKAADEVGVELFFQMPPRGDPAEQKEKIDQVLNQGVKAVAISVIAPDKQNDYLKAISKKVALLTQDNDAPDSGRLCYIGTDNYEAGRAAGALVKQALPDGGTVAIFVGQLDALNARQRRQGVVDELAGQKDAPTDDGATLGKYKLHKTYTDQPEGVEKAKANAVQAITDLQNQPNVCLVGLWAYNPPAILSAVKDQGKLGKMKVVGFDEDTATLEGIKSGDIFGTIVQQPYEFGYVSVKLMSEIIKGDKKGIPADGIRYVPHLAVTKDGKGLETAAGKKTEGRKAEEFHKQLNRL